MTIESHIRDHFLSRLQSRRCLVVHDPDGLFRPLLPGVVGEDDIYIDAEQGLLEARERAMEAWKTLTRGAPRPGFLLLRVPWSPMLGTEEQVRDPFAPFRLFGSEFPSGDHETFEELCRQAFPEKEPEVRKLFASGVPSFSAINSLAGGRSWPRLQELLGEEAPAQILAALMAPTESQARGMAAATDWMPELLDLASDLLGFHPPGKSPRWDDVRNGLWRHVLLSEFLFDLPGEAPPALRDVPRAPDKARPVVYKVASLLREGTRSCPVYLEWAERVASDLKLESLTRSVADFGERDTFAFEERCFLRKFVEAICAQDWAGADRIAASRRHSVWVRESERQLAWNLANEACELLRSSIETRKEIEAVASKAAELASFHTARSYRLDTLHRRFEQAVLEAMDLAEECGDLVRSARGSYHETIALLHAKFVRSLGTTWPIPGMARATRIFPESVAPLLEKKGTKVAYFMVDAFRFELAVAFASGIGDGMKTELGTACAQLPCITRVGMAALLPGADGSLEIRKKGTEWVPHVQGRAVLTPDDRLQCLQAHYGDRCAMVELGEFVKSGGKKQDAVPAGIDLLVVRTNEIDEQGEIGVDSLHAGIRSVLAKLAAALKKLQKLGFHHVVITADHGFHLPDPDPTGNLTAKPAGDWSWQKPRVLLGSGDSSASCIAWTGNEAGLKGDFERMVFPATLATFEKVPGYFHEGLSLQESLIPVLRVDLGPAPAPASALPEVTLSYRGQQSGTVTTRRPMIDLSIFGADLFAGTGIRVRVEAVSQGKVIGGVAVCPSFNEALGCLEVEPGRALKVPLRLDDDFRGEFEVSATDPGTGVRLARPITLKLETLE